MTDLMTSHISLKSSVFSSFTQHGAIHRGAFRHGAHGDPRLRRQEDRDHGGVAAIDNEAVGVILRFHIVPLKDTTQKHVINTSLDSMAFSTDSDGTTETENTW